MDAMTMPTKAQIDALFEARDKADPGWTTFRLSRSEAYEAAGLNADGSEKAVRAIRDVYLTEGHGPRVHTEGGTWDGTTFTPDGAL